MYEDIVEEMFDRSAWNISMQPTIRYCAPEARSAIAAQILINKNYVREMTEFLTYVKSHPDETTCMVQ